MTNQRIDLAGTWQLAPAQRPEDPISAAIPGDTHSALLAAGRIADPYWGTNELALQDLNRQDWRLSRNIAVSADFLAAGRIYLCCESLDTIADISLNGHPVGQARNMFVRQRFDVTQALQEGDNQLEILLHSAETHALQLSRALPYEIPYSEYPIQSPHRNLVRKVQCHAGWDWGCCLMVAGLYGTVYLEAQPMGHADYVYTEQTHADGRCDLTVICEVEAPEGGATELHIDCGGQRLREPIKLQPGRSVLRRTLTIDQPLLWWPAGYGDQPLYDLEVKIAGDRHHQQVGLRTLELITEQDDIGLGFKFRANGVDIFAKGANWIPCDALPARQTRAAVADLLTSAVEAHMNMIRVWGGGQYESDDFYQLCDEKGLLVWQDFMFSCSTYPATADFLDQVKAEARHQIKRLRHHACLALWCGNNEDLGALNWFEPSRRDRDRYLVDYDRLNEGVLGRLVDELDPERTFWPSSPCGGRGDYSDNWHDDSRGDMHYWRVWHEGKSFADYHAVTPRFCSEFGYQSFPSLDCIKTYAPGDQFNVTAPIMEHHQRNDGGNSKITEMFTRYFRMPDGFAHFVYLSQVQQGLAIKTAVEYWRHLRPTCMGTLYWQLNDLWPVCSWSSLEYGGKWKLLHHMARRFYAPVLISSFQNDDDQLEIWVTNDRKEPTPIQARLRIVDFSGTIQQEKAWNQTLDAGSAQQLDALAVAELITDGTAAFAVLDLEAEGITLRNEHFFAPYKSCILPDAQVQTRIEEVDEGFAVTVTTDQPAFYLTLNADGLAGEFDDNCFTLLGGESRTLTFQAKGEAPTLAQFQDALTVLHLRATYQ